MSIRDYIKGLGRQAKGAAVTLATVSSTAKNDMLTELARLLRAGQADVLTANGQDLEEAEKQQLSQAMVDRLTLTPQRLEALAAAVEEVRALPDPVGEVAGLTLRPNGLQVGKMRIPLGVLAFIYESRPNVTIDAAALCVKSGNAVILRGGKEAIHSNLAFMRLIKGSLTSAGLPEHAVQVVDTIDRRAVEELLKLDDDVNLLIPRGGEGLIRYVAEHSRIPVIKHFKGVCHVYVDQDANLDMALAIAKEFIWIIPGRVIWTVVSVAAVEETPLSQLCPLRRPQSGECSATSCRTRPRLVLYFCAFWLLPQLALCHPFLSLPS